MTIEINDQFKQALHLMDSTDRSLFITGKAGTGKSTLLQYFCQNTEKNPVILAPTGVSALNVKGQTIHNFFNLYIDVTPQKIKQKDIKIKNPKLYKGLKTIIIDEISMVRADLLDCIDVFLRMYGPNHDKAFGGVQMIFIGDLYQLPPVVASHEQEIFNSYYKTQYFFSAHVFAECAIQIVELKTIYRQKDQDFVDLLSRIRNNSVNPHDISWLNSRFTTELVASDDIFYISLTTTNKKADEINQQYLQALAGDLHESEAKIQGNFSKEYFPTAQNLQFKIGAQVMLLNNDSKKRWVNGSIGIIEDLRRSEEGEYLSIRLSNNNKRVSVYPYDWELYRFSLDGSDIVTESVGTFSQYPLRLAWAITIHKSQGKTFDHVIIDIGSGTFVTGQLYVALSRCTSFEGIKLKNIIKQHHIRMDQRITEFFTRSKFIDQ